MKGRRAEVDGLPEMYARLNRDYFNGRKPHYRVLRSSRVAEGYCDTARRRILLGSGLSGTDLEATLLHEMCHIGMSGGHGRHFQARIRRLISIAPPDVANCLQIDLVPREEMLTLRQIVFSCLESLAMEHPATPWGQVRRQLVRREMPPTFNERERRVNARVLRGAKREWARLRRDAARMAIGPGKKS